MKQMRKVLLCAVLLGSMTYEARAGLMPHANVVSLTAQSDLVIKGRVTRYLRYSVSLKPRWAVEIHVDQALKGSLDGPRAFISVQPSSLGKYADISDGEYGIFFLVKRGESSLVFTDPNFPRVVSSPGRVVDQRNGSDLDRVAQGIADVLKLSVPLAGDIGGGVADDIRMVGSYIVGQDGSIRRVDHVPSHTRIAEGTYMSAISALRTMPVDVRITALKNVADVKAGGLGKVWATGELLRLGDNSRLPEVAGFLVNHAPSDSLTATALDQDVMRASIPSDQADGLYALLNAKDVEVRRVAVHALGRTVPNTSEHAIRRAHALAALLEDRDALVRLEAAEGVCNRSDKCDGLNVRQLAAVDDLRSIRTLAASLADDPAPQ